MGYIALLEKGDSVGHPFRGNQWTAVGPDGYALNEWVSLDPSAQPRSAVRGRPEFHAIGVRILSYKGGKYTVEDENGFRFRARAEELSGKPKHS